MIEREHIPQRIRALPTHAGTSPIQTHRLSAEGCDVLFVVAPAGSDVGLHAHDTDNVTVIVSGETALTVDGHTRRYGVGEWYETAAGEQHAVHFDVDTVQIELRFARTSTS